MHAALVPGGEHGAMAAAHAVGNQTISPMIQLIMRMPGHLGLVTSFFECLGAFFAPLKEMLSTLDLNILSAHAGSVLTAASHTLGDAASHTLGAVGVGGHFDLSSLLPSGAPILNMPDGTGFEGLAASSGHGLGVGEFQFNSSEPGLVSHDSFNVSGYADGAKVNFEGHLGEQFQNPGSAPGNFEHQFLAMDNNSAIFRPSVGAGVQTIPIPSAAQVPVPAQPSGLTDFSHSVHGGTPAGGDAGAHAHSAPHQDAGSHARDASSENHRGSLLGHHAHEAGTAGHHPEGKDATETADSGHEAGTDYTIKHGDSLWKIAHEQLGDSSKWHDIFKMNQGVLGDNPSLIHSGTTLHLPGGHEIASNYTVHSGDNLWDISKSHLGGGQHWPELYHNNSDIIGSNPSLIHPGQHLSLSDHGQVAQADGGHHQFNQPTHTTHHELAHATSSHHSPAHEAAHAGHNKIASASGTQQVAAGSQQVPQALAQTPGGAQSAVGLHAAPMGKLETSASPVQSYDQ